MLKRMSTRLLTLALLAVIVVAASVGGAQTTVAAGDDGLERAIAAQERHTDNLLAKPGVVGTAVGHGPGGRAAVFVLTETPGVAGIPKKLDGVAVVPQVTGKVVALHHRAGHGGGPSGGGNGDIDRTARFDRPVPIGVSTGHPDITAGTIGARVTDGTNVYALSNNHVYADENTASLGDPALQPGAIDGGTDPADRIATLADFEPIVFSTSANNVIDAAIALSSTANLGNATPSDGYGIPKSATTGVFINQKLQKYGRTTGLTKGFVWAVNVTVNVGYSSGTARFVNQIMIAPGSFSAGGDSGSLVLSNQRGSSKRKPVGLLFAGSSLFTFANPIGPVLDRFGVMIDGA